MDQAGSGLSVAATTCPLVPAKAGIQRKKIAGFPIARE
jgi:hypothetical protein